MKAWLTLALSVRSRSLKLMEPLSRSWVGANGAVMSSPTAPVALITVMAGASLLPAMVTVSTARSEV